VSHQGRGGGLTLDWNSGFSLTEGADPAIIWQYKFSQLRGSSDDGKSKLKLHFQDVESRSIETLIYFDNLFSLFFFFFT
jgi:gamma-syntrophin